MKWQGTHVIGQVMDLLSQFNDQSMIPFGFWRRVRPDKFKCICLPNLTANYRFHFSKCTFIISLPDRWWMGWKRRLFLQSKSSVNTRRLFRSSTNTRSYVVVVAWQSCLICIWHTTAQSSAHLRSGSYSKHHINQAPVVVDLNEKMLGSPKRWLIVTDPADPNESL